MDTSVYHELLEGVPAHSAGLRRLAAHVLGGTADADDVIQDAWLRILSSRRTDSVPGIGWLRGVVRNVARERLRARARRDRREDAAQPPGPAAATSDVVARAEQMEILLRHLRALPEPYATTLARRYLDGMSSVEIGELDGTPPTTVRTRCTKGLALLRQRLAAPGHSHGLALLLPISLQPGTSATTHLPHLLGVALSITIRKQASAQIAVLLLLLGSGSWLVLGTDDEEQSTTPDHTASEVTEGSQPARTAGGRGPVLMMSARRARGSAEATIDPSVPAPATWKLVVAWDAKDAAWSQDRTGEVRVQLVSRDRTRSLGDGRLTVVGTLGKDGGLLERPWLNKELTFSLAEPCRVVLLRCLPHRDWLPVYTGPALEAPRTGTRRLEIRREQLALPSGRVSGRLTRHDGTVAKGYKMHLDVSVPDAPAGTGSWSSEARVSGDGSFAFESLPKNSVCRLSTRAPASVRDDLGARIEGLAVRPGAGELDLVLPRPTPGQHVRFRIVNAAGDPFTLPERRACVTIIRGESAAMEGARRLSFVVVGESAAVQDLWDSPEQLVPGDDFWVAAVFAEYRSVAPARVLWESREMRTIELPVEPIPRSDATALRLALRPSDGVMPRSLTLVLGYDLSGNAHQTRAVVDGMIELGAVPRGARVRILIGNQLKPYDPEHNPWIHDQVARDHLVDRRLETITARLERAGGVRISYDKPEQAPAEVQLTSGARLLRSVDENTGGVSFSSRPLPGGRITLTATGPDGASRSRRNVTITPGTLLDLKN